MIFLDIEDLDSIVAWEREHYAEGVTHIDEEKEFTVEVGMTQWPWFIWIWVILYDSWNYDNDFRKLLQEKVKAKVSNTVSNGWDIRSKYTLLFMAYNSI